MRKSEAQVLRPFYLKDERWGRTSQSDEKEWSVVSRREAKWRQSFKEKEVISYVKCCWKVKQIDWEFSVALATWRSLVKQWLLIWWISEVESLTGEGSGEKWRWGISDNGYKQSIWGVCYKDMKKSGRCGIKRKIFVNDKNYNTLICWWEWSINDDAGRKGENYWSSVILPCDPCAFL